MGSRIRQIAVTLIEMNGTTISRIFFASTAADENVQDTGQFDISEESEHSFERRNFRAGSYQSY